MWKLFCTQGHEMELKDTGPAGEHARCTQCKIDWTHISLLLTSENCFWGKPAKSPQPGTANASAGSSACVAPLTGQRIW
jgi:hypothetical protein